MQKVNSFCLILLLAGKCFSQAPNQAWIRSIGGASSDHSYALAVDVSGNVLTTGSFNGTVDFEPGPGVYSLTSNGQFISKLDPLGHFVWAKQVNNAIGLSITTDPSGNVYTTGYFVGTTDFDPGSGVFNLTGGGGENVFISKLDSDGNFVWAKSFGSTTPSRGFSIALDPSGNIYTTGFFNGTVDFDPGAGVYNMSEVAGGYDIFISKLDSSGNFIWAKAIGSAGVDIGYGIKTDHFGNVYSTGQFQGTADFDPNGGSFPMTPPSLSPEIFVMKLDGLGNFVWAKDLGGSNYDIAYSIDLDTAGNVFTTGVYQGTADFDPGPGVYNLIGSTNYNIYVSKLDNSGNFGWAKTLASNFYQNYGYSIAIDRLGNVYSTGLFSYIADFDPDTTSTATFNLTASGQDDIYISKLDNSGNFVWVKQIGGTSTETGTSIALDIYGNVYSTGYYSSPTMTSDLFTITNVDASSSSSDFYISKLGSLQKVWPGDANNNYHVDNTDLLPIGLYYGQSGTPRGSISNVWQADSAADWGILQTNGFDIKHGDCNGDGTIDANDTLAVNLNYSFIHALTSYIDHARSSAPDLYLVTSSSTYNPGDMIDVEVWTGTSANPVNNLYGLAFNINYDASLIQAGSESLTYPNSWIGTPGTNTIKIAKIDPLANTAYGALTRIDHVNANGFGKIADFKFQTKTTISSSVLLNLFVSNYVSNDLAGAPIAFNLVGDSITIYVSATGVSETNHSNGFTISPNPFSAQTSVIFAEQQEHTIIKITDLLGKEIKTVDFTGKEFILEKESIENGVYFIQTTDMKKNRFTKKIIIE